MQHGLAARYLAMTALADGTTPPQSLLPYSSFGYCGTLIAGVQSIGATGVWIGQPAPVGSRHPSGVDEGGRKNRELRDPRRKDHTQ